ncbi:MAG: PH domain-containing protein [Archaeoglobaceae archaeon]|nr:PH domain-containing protein [Archaeoglobaceae archaeon]MDW8118915.1 PH domain-containing protein [Archaeoglobaceae archaeon]
MILYEDRPYYDNWAKLVLSFGPSLMLLLILLIEYKLLPTESAEEDILAKEILLISLVAIVVVYWAILPRKYEISHDKFRIVLGIFSYTIPIEDIAEVRRAGMRGAFIYRGARFNTSIKNIVEIRKKNGGGVLISPSNPEIFIDFLNRALKRR